MKSLQHVNERINPSITNSRHLILSFLSSQIKIFAEEMLREKENLKLLDVGCGLKPYKPYFDEVASLYIGIDRSLVTKNVDVQAVAENLCFKDCSFDIILCTQVLEHTASPQKVLSELNRVTKKRGLLILSTHGIWTEQHENPDFWRWTMEGLQTMLGIFGFEIVKSCSMDPYSSVIQILLLYAPENALSKYTINPFLNVMAKVLRPLADKGPKLHIVHTIVARRSK